MFYYLYADSFGPYRELLYCCCAEGIACGYDDFLIILAENVCELCYAGGFSCSVYACDEQDGGAGLGGVELAVPVRPIAFYVFL